jgi:hypothetical protein
MGKAIVWRKMSPLCMTMVEKGWIFHGGGDQNTGEVVVLLVVEA